MKFHSSAFGSNISLLDEYCKAQRINDNHYCDAIVFSESPLNEPIAIEVHCLDAQCKGCLVIGVTSSDPLSFISESKSSLKYSYPFGLCTEDNVWLQPVVTQYPYSRFVLYKNDRNELIAVTNTDKSILILKDIPSQPLWLILDLFGNVYSVNFVNSDCISMKIPQNILTMGPNATVEFRTMCSDSVVKYNNGRVFFIGPFGAGKSNVKRLLVGQSADDEDKCNTLDTSVHCYSNKRGIWKTSLEIAECNNEVIEEVMTDALAYNVSKSLLLKRQEVIDGTTTSCSAGDLMKSALRLSKKNRPIDANDPDYAEMVNGLSENAKELVLNYLTQSEDVPIDDQTNNDFDAFIKFDDYDYFKYNLWDFSGNSLFFIINQILLTPYAVFVIVIDVSEDLDAPVSQSNESLVQVEMRKKDFSTLQLIHFWLTVIYSQVGTFTLSSTSFDENNDDKSDEQTISSPKVLIIGTHRNSVHLEPITRDQMINDTFDRIIQSLEGKVYKNLVHPNCVAIDCMQMSCDEPSLVTEICERIDNLFIDQKLINFDIPYLWVELRKIFNKLIKRGIYFADFRQIHEVTRSQFGQFNSPDNLQMALDFYHSHGIIYCFTSTYLGVCETLVILDPLWLITNFHRFCDSYHLMNDEEKESFFTGIFKEELIDKIWHNEKDHKLLFIGCLERLDIICELCPYISVDEAPDVAASAMQSKMYIFPWITQTLPETLNGVGLEYDLNDNNSLELTIDFNGLLPIGLFSRFSVRLCRWSWSQGWGRRPEVCHSETRIAVDFDHDLIIKIKLEKSHINVFIIKIYEGINNEQSVCSSPTPNICVKVRHLIETELEIIQSTFYRRVTYSLQVRCPCELVCVEHNKRSCQQEECVHYLPLNDCLINKVVECDYRQIRTNFVQKFFPQASFYSAGIANYDQLALSENATGNVFEAVAGWETVFNVEPTWMKDASKMLATNPGRDWIALAKRLGYSDRDVSKLVDEVTPALALLRDWYESNGRTRYCIDVLLSCLRMISREDVINSIESDVEPEGSAPPIFISYQWDSQQVVLDLRRRLELSGFPCWMDVGLVAGGDSLYGKIYEGVSRAKVVVCCLTPRYVASRLCTREVTLADVLHKPILPIMVEPTPWPPPGPMAVIMSSLVFIDLCNIGAHGGIGKRGDSETRFRDILDRIARYLSGYVDTPLIPRNFPILDLFSPVRNVTPQMSAAPAELRSQTPEEQPPAAEANANASQAARGAEADNFAADNFSDDSISVIQTNRVTNCSICVIL